MRIGAIQCPLPLVNRDSIKGQPSCLPRPAKLVDTSGKTLEAAESANRLSEACAPKACE
jgi:hypothetical protein